MVMIFLSAIAAAASSSSSMPPLLPSVDPTSDEEDSAVPCGFEPKVAVVVGVLAALLCVTFFLVLYGQHCKRIVSARAAAAIASAPAIGSSTRHHHQVQGGMLRLPVDSHGSISQWLLDALPKLRPSRKLQGDGVLGLDECPVCLSRYESGDLLRLLPRCKHAFHVACVDRWLVSRPSCPVCRTFVSCQDVVDLDNYYLHEEQPACQEQPGEPAQSPPPPPAAATPPPPPPPPAAAADAVVIKVADDPGDLSLPPVSPASTLHRQPDQDDPATDHSVHSDLATTTTRNSSLDSSSRCVTSSSSSSVVTSSSFFFSPKLMPSSSIVVHTSI